MSYVLCVGIDQTVGDNLVIMAWNNSTKQREIANFRLETKYMDDDCTDKVIRDSLDYAREHIESMKNTHIYIPTLKCLADIRNLLEIDSSDDNHTYVKLSLLSEYTRTWMEKSIIPHWGSPAAINCCSQAVDSDYQSGQAYTRWTSTSPLIPRAVMDMFCVYANEYAQLLLPVKCPTSKYCYHADGHAPLTRIPYVKHNMLEPESTCPAGHKVQGDIYTAWIFAQLARYIPDFVREINIPCKRYRVELPEMQYGQYAQLVESHGKAKITL